MAKMTKAAARKRLYEAIAKINLVQIAAMQNQLSGVAIADIKKLYPMTLELLKIADRMK